MTPHEYVKRMKDLAPAHQAFREKMAEAFASENPHLDRRHVFVAGAEAEHEVARLIGALEELKTCAKWTDFEYRIREREIQLAALLEGK